MLRSYPTVKGESGPTNLELATNLRYKPNRRMIVPKTFLGLYNVGMDLKQDTAWYRRLFLKLPSVQKWDRRTINWLTTGIGEAPVAIDLEQIKADSAALYHYCFGHGYFHPQVTYAIDTLSSGKNHRMAIVSYAVNAGTPYKIQEVSYSSQAGPESPLEFFYKKEESLIKPGDNYNQDLLTAERVRATNELRNQGFFTFNQNMIQYEVDTALQANLPDSAGIEPSPKKIDIGVEIVADAHSYYVREIQVLLKSPADDPDMKFNFSRKIRAIDLTEAEREQLRLPQDLLNDSVAITFMVSAKLLKRINYNFLASKILLREGEIFKQTDARNTQLYLQELGMIQYLVVSYQPNDTLQSIDVVIDIMMAAQYQVKAGAESFTTNFTSTNLPSLGGTLSFRNKNVFRKSELLELNLLGNVGFYSSLTNSGQFDNVFYEYGGNLNLNFRQVLLPKALHIQETLGTSSTITGSFRKESRQEFDRTTLGLNLGYLFNNKPYDGTRTSRFNPLTIDLIDINIRDSTFQRSVDSLPSAIRRDYQRRYSSRSRYTYTQGNYRKTRAYPTYSIQYIAEVGGNIPFLMDLIFAKTKYDSLAGDNLLFNRLYYGQYVRGSVEGKYFVPLGAKSEVVFRGFLGLSTPFNGTPTVPLESRFFSGGTNSMRGWQSNTLGPGRTSLATFQGTTGDAASVSSLIAPGGEYKLEMNVEYRFDLYSYLEMAFFTDIGNVWFNNTAVNREQLGETSVFSLDNFVLGWDAGVGFRFDFSFLILRMDVAQQLMAPDLEKHWVPGNPDATNKGPRFNLGIGYPF